ncbi:hypothetical protein GCM10025770_38090 [Viridibacterium curvum]|uniref:Uncharacterized protein n=2 Tax=Viridibacterium curvum TaxID=1101404 RepID=A0ABP9R7A2_9RHOO
MTVPDAALDVLDETELATDDDDLLLDTLLAEDELCTLLELELLVELLDELAVAGSYEHTAELLKVFAGKTDDAHVKVPVSVV